MKTSSAIEPLESRIAPAILVNPTTVTFVDDNGDDVTVKVSKGSWQLTDANGGEPGDNFTFIDLGGGRQHLMLLDLHNSGPFSKANVTFTAKLSASGLGDGHVNVDFIDASGTDLGNVNLPGDLGRIEAGDPNTRTMGLAKLSVASMGRLVPNASTLIEGALGSLVITGDLDTAIIDVTGGVGTPGLGKIGSVSIGGTVRGSGVADSGSIEATGDIGVVTISGDLRGSTGNLSGRIHAIGKIGNVTIGGSVVGGNGAGSQTGHLLGELGIGMVKIGGDLAAGSGLDSGSIHSGAGKLGGLTVGGSLIGGAAADPSSYRQVSAGSDIGPVKIGGDLRGAAGNGSAEISAMGRIASLKIGGSVIGAAGIGSGSVSSLGLGPVTVGGSVLGGGIDAGQVVALGNHDVASMTIGGSVTGGSGAMSGVVGSFQGTLGPTKIGGDVRGGSGPGTGQIFGGEKKMPSLTIGGSVIGTNFAETGRIAAGIAGTIKIGGNLEGGSISGNEDTDRSGYIQATRIGSIFIGGAIIAGTDTSNVLDRLSK